MSNPAAPRSFEFATQVDVFAERILEGNQLAIFPDARGLSSAEMQALARETNLSETTFILPSATPLPSSPKASSVRIFTTEEELPFAGHPTLGTASWLFWNHPQLRNASEIRLKLRAGIVPVRFDQPDPTRPGIFATMRQNDPTFGSTHPPEAVARALGLSPEDLDPTLPVQTVSTGLPFAIVPLRSLEGRRPPQHPAGCRPRVPRPHRRALLLRDHPRRPGQRCRFPRPHAVRQRGRPRHRLRFRLRHRLPRPPWPRRQPPGDRAGAGHRNSSPESHSPPRYPPGKRRHRCVRRRPHHPRGIGTPFPALTHRLFTPQQHA